MRNESPLTAFFDDAYFRVLAPLYSEEATRAEVAAVRELARLAQSDCVLDLGCGWGRHLSLLRAAGHDVVGLDRSPALLRRVPPPGRVCGDMAALPFETEAFDAVLNLATSIGLYLDGDAALTALAEARRVLRPDGRFLIEGMHRDDVVSGFAPRDHWTLEDGTEIRIRRRLDAEAGISHEVLRWRTAGGREGKKRHSLRLRTATELIELLELAGFRVRQTWGDWDGASFRHDAPRLIVLAEPGGGAYLHGRSTDRTE